MTEQTFTEAPASVNFRATNANGFTVQFTMRNGEMGELVKRVDQLTGHLLASGWAAQGSNGYQKRSGNGNGQSANNGNAPLCPTHGKPMKPSKYGGWYCPVKIADDGGDGKPVYCKQKVKE